ncbi:MAG: phytanoyl-CoA dioxygenase family protein [Xanthomonadales bacterium]|nr:phytanoyl-CoA dioxygenase family protein [Xanthomonadales bacterium]
MQIEQIKDPDYWRKLIPGLTVSEGGEAMAPAEVSTGARDREQLMQEGYVQFDGALERRQAERLAEAVLQLGRSGYLPLFGFIYDEFWDAFSALGGLLRFALGDQVKMLPEFWVWNVDPGREEAGWRPHRDKQIDTLLADGMPKSATVWMALTDATPLNGCMYLLPASRDKAYRDFESGRTPVELQSVRALPVPAGSVLLWNQRVYHWGARSSRFATEPRISMAFEFQRGDVDPFHEPLLPVPCRPPFDERLKLIGKQILQYRHMYSFSDELAEAAVAMGGDTLPRFNPAAAPTAAQAPRPPAPTSNVGKPGRNDPCPCGSGKKYKRCHGRPDRMRTASE